MIKDENKVLIKKYYKAWEYKDINTLKSVYSKNTKFNDPFFKNLDYEKTINMWDMLFSRSETKNNIQYKYIGHSNDTYSYKLEIQYYMNGNKINNVIYDDFIIKNKKIYRHNANFDKDKWFKMAFKYKWQQKLLFKKIVVKKINKNLEDFQKNNI